MQVSGFREPDWLSATQRSVLAEIKLQANRYESPIEHDRLVDSFGEIGVAFLYERRIRGWKTGIHDGMVILHPAFPRSDISSRSQALATLLGKRSVASLRFYGLCPDSLSSWEGEADRVTSTNTRDVLRLAPDFPAFLKSLGKHTRRNMQHCRKWTVTNQIRVENGPLKLAQITEVALNNMPLPKQLEQLLHNIRYSESQSFPFQISLMSGDGKALSTAGGYIEGSIAYLIYQANDRHYRDLNPSLMLRAHLIEQLIGRDVEHLAFVGGCGGVLLHQCEIVPTGELLLVRKSIIAGMKHFLASSMTGAANRIGRLAPHFL